MSRQYQDNLSDRIRKLDDDDDKLEKTVLRLKFCVDKSRDDNTLFICSSRLIETAIELLEQSAVARGEELK